MSNYDLIMKLSLERGFYFPSSELYSDAPAGYWEYGPNGINLKNNFIQLWRKELIRRDSMVEIDGAQIMSKNVFIASGHIENFSDPIIKCSKCNLTLRADRFITERTNIDVPERLSDDKISEIIKHNALKCPKCNSEFTNAKRFNMMFKIGIGPDQEEAYLRPETCQSIFVDFSRIFKIMRGKFPFGIGQIGKSFRNEIAPRQSLLRLREFYQAEIEIFFNPSSVNNLSKFEEIKSTKLNVYSNNTYYTGTIEEFVEKGIIPNKLVGYYLAILIEFYSKTGIKIEKTRFRKLSDDEKAFYASVAFDFEVETSLGWLELVACNDRSNYDLLQHSKISKKNLEVIDPNTQTKVLPHVFELSIGIDRSIYTILEHSFYEDIENKRTVLQLTPNMAPIIAGILPLVKKDGLDNVAQKVFSDLKKDFNVFYDDSGSIGRRYRRLEEIGTPLAITIDHQTMMDNSVTVRYRDSMKQERLEISSIRNFINEFLSI